jgi:PKD repeat protein
MKVQDENKPILTLTIHPKQGFIPLTAIIEAELINYQGKEDAYRCLVEEWDFGDGSKSQHQSNCKDTKTFQTKFITTHIYEAPGNYRIQLTLGNKIIKSQIQWINAIYNGM